MKIQRERFLSLDIFRGMTICFMIIVNTPGSGAMAFSPLEHATWHGFTPTDLVFPSFLFAVGNAMSFSLDKYRELGDKAFLNKVFKRTILLFLAGYLMYWFPFFRLEGGHVSGAPIGNTRIMGVLQRISLCYCFASLMIHYLSAKKVYFISGMLLIGYWLILLFFGDHNQPFSLLGNAGLYLDRAILGNNHLYHGENVYFDPEGILSTLPAIVNVVIGFYAGKFIQRNGKNYDTIAKLMLFGALFIFIALAWNMVFPINKKLWSSPFVLLTTGIDLMLLPALIFAVEIDGWNRFNWNRFFLVFGKNPLLIYLFSELVVVLFYMVPIGTRSNLYNSINKNSFQVIAPGPVGSLLFAICYMLLCWSFGWWLDKREKRKRNVPDLYKLES